MLGNTISVNINPTQRHIGQSGQQQFTVQMGVGVDGAKSEPQHTLHHVLLFNEGKNVSQGCVRAKVMAVAELEGKIYYIAASEELMLFEPVLREVLYGFLDVSHARITCLYEKSCGAVIFRRHSGNLEYLLIQNKKGNNWGFPKGHMELHESECDTAIREVQEETGLHIQLLDGFRAVSEYHPKGRITKQVIFFVAEMTGENIVIQKSEIERFIWADYTLALRTFKFNNDKKVLMQAKAWLSDRLY